MKRILIADDQLGWRNFHTEAVKQVLDSDVSIETAESAEMAYSKILENNQSPYDVIITDMQMEDNYAPKMAGEWLIEQIQTLSSYYKTSIIIVSASPKIKFIAENYNVDYIPKRVATTSLEPYKYLLLKE